MDYFLTNHAQQRMKERGISKKLLNESLEEPTKVLKDSTGRTLIKKLYLRGN